MECFISAGRCLYTRDPMIYGQFLEHFHRQVYGGIYQPLSPLADEDGFRTDVLEALKRIRVPVIRWPGGCFVSSYHWRKGVGQRLPSFDKAWRVEDPNTFGTDEFVLYCRKLGCEPYICTNAGTGTAEEMSDWMEYCNLKDEGEFARLRASGGHPEPYRVKYWSIGNENYGSWEIGAKDAMEWSRLVLESAKMLRRVDPDAELSAAALTDIDWNVALLKMAAPHLKWISIHAYWDPLAGADTPAGYEKCMSYTADLDAPVRKVRGLLNAMGYEKKIRIAFDEWNLRGWHHPNIHTVYQGLTPDEYLSPRDRNDINATYTMADAVFSACVLNMFLRNADIVGMGNYSPMVNTRGLIFTHDRGLVRRTTYYVFELYTQHMYDTVVDCYTPQTETMRVNGIEVNTLDVAVTRDSVTGALAVSAVNKHPSEQKDLVLHLDRRGDTVMRELSGPSFDSFNDIEHEPVRIRPVDAYQWLDDRILRVTLAPHSVNVISIL